MIFETQPERVRRWFSRWHSVALAAVAVAAAGLQAKPPALPAEATAAARSSITNPILPTGNDPWVIRHGDFYYYCGSSEGAVFVGKSESLQTIGTHLTDVWIPPRGTAYAEDLWAPELHFIDGRWFIYVAADDGRNEHHQMYVLRAKTADPQGDYELLGAMDTGVDTPEGHQRRWAIDGTTLELNGKLYFVWSGWSDTKNIAQNLYIAPMSNPWTISGPRVLISKPELPWEIRGRPLVNEGPTALQHAGKTFIVYSASGSWGNHYCLGRLTLVGTDPLKPENWRKHPDPVFAGTSKVISPGHASFVNDGKRDWIVYHTAKYPGAGWNRNVCLQPFTWASDGAPVFGAPVAPQEAIQF